MKNSIRNPTRLSSLCDDVTVGFVGSMSHLFSEKGVPLLRGQNVRPGKLVLDNLKFVPTSVHDQWRKSALSGGEIVLVRVGYPGTACVIPDGLGAMNAASLVIVRPRSHELDSHYLCQLFNSEWGRSKILANQVGNAQQVLNVGAVADLLIPKPPLPEQCKIADILTTWDEALEKLDALIEAQERRKKALMQQLLTGKKRLKGFKKPWKRFRFSDLLEPQDRYIEFDDSHTYSLVSIRRRSCGVFFREALLGSDIKTKVMKRVFAGDFLISRMQVVHGALGMVRPECDGMYASDSYDVLVAKDENLLHMPFLDWVSRLRSFWHLAYISSHGVHIEKMTFNLSDFMHENITIPSDVEEQRQIATILDTADQQLTLIRNQRTALDQQKRGLMQRLLTGNLRVKI